MKNIRIRILRSNIEYIALWIGERCVKLLRWAGYEVTWDYFEGVLII